MIDERLFGGTNLDNPYGDAPGKTNAVGFDETTVTAMRTPTAAGGISTLGVATVYTVPARVDAAELRELAVHSSDEGRFTTQCWWQLLIEDGATQELLFRSSALPLSEWGGPFPNVTAGMQFSRYGSLQRPAHSLAQLRQGQRLLIPVFTAAAVVGNQSALTLYVRVRGVIFRSLDAGAAG